MFSSASPVHKASLEERSVDRPNAAESQNDLKIFRRVKIARSS